MGSWQYSSIAFCHTVSTFLCWLQNAINNYKLNLNQGNPTATSKGTEYSIRGASVEAVMLFSLGFLVTVLFTLWSLRPNRRVCAEHFGMKTFCPLDFLHNDGIITVCLFFVPIFSRRYRHAQWRRRRERWPFRPNPPRLPRHADAECPGQCQWNDHAWLHATPNGKSHRRTQTPLQDVQPGTALGKKLGQ